MKNCAPVYSHNKLGDNLSPVFSTGEFQNLKFLRVLDLSYNGLVGIADTLIKGCENLKVKSLLSQCCKSANNCFAYAPARASKMGARSM
jgi:hypothetical protein